MLDYFMKRVFQDDNGCWLWQGSLGYTGYGTASVNGKNVRAHRYLYALLVGPIDPGLELDHLCKVRSCVNPDHLEAVTHADNVRRTVNANSLKTHCPRGHIYWRGNILLRTRPGRECRRCHYHRNAIRQARRAVEAHT